MLLKKVFNALNSLSMCISSSHSSNPHQSSLFSWDAHSKQLFCLDEEGFLWLSFYSFGPWYNSFDLCRTLYAFDAISSCIVFLFYLTFMFYFCVSKKKKKIQNHIKSEKFKKFDRICLSTYPMCVWPRTFVQTV